MNWLVRPPKFLRALYSEAVWRMDKTQPTLYLTFDDGPIPVVTPWVLDVLKDHGVKASFFCVGHNVEKHPAIFERVLAEGHTVGNHTYHHIKGWNSTLPEYLNEVEQCQRLTQSPFFRPPYGRMKYAQYKAIREDYRIILWDVLTYDYESRVSPQQCLKNATQYTRNGSILLFHDSVKSEPRLRYALPRTLDHFLKKGYSFSRF